MEQKPLPSASALNVARCRAIAAHETRAAIRGNDTLAEVFLDEAARASLRDPLKFPFILNKLAEFSPGSYEYFIARTAYLDNVVATALRAQIPQLVFLGAGYDTRAYRFSALLTHTRVFELDEPNTQAHKRSMLEDAQVAISPQIAYVPINFNNESLLDRLAAAGYQRDMQTLFIWEGVTYYLPPVTVNATLSFIRHTSEPGSVVAFDYMLPQDQLEGRFGAVRARSAMQALYTSEPLHFDLAETQVQEFLDQRGFALVEHLSPAEMQQRYLTLEDGTSAGEMLDLFRLVRARVC